MHSNLYPEMQRAQVALGMKVSTLRDAAKKLEAAMSDIRDEFASHWNSELPGVADHVRRTMPRFMERQQQAIPAARDAQVLAEKVREAIAYSPHFDVRHSFTTQPHEEAPTFTASPTALAEPAQAALASGAGA